MNLQAWLSATTGKPIHADNQYGAQCWDLWSDYAQRVVGVPYLATLTRAGGQAPHPGWACNVFHNAPAALAEYFDVIGPTRLGERGDVAFWEKGTLYPGSHVAVVLTDNGKTLTTHSQNPNLPRTVTIAKRDLLGYLRPRKGPFMALTDTQQTELLEKTRKLHKLFAEPDARGWTFRDIVQSHVIATLAEVKAKGDGGVNVDELTQKIVDEQAARLAG